MSTTVGRARAGVVTALTTLGLLLTLVLAAGATDAAPAPTSASVLDRPALLLLAGGQDIPVASSMRQIQDELRGALAAGDAGRRVPRGTRPDFDQLVEDKSQFEPGCVAEEIESVRHDLCERGDPGGRRTVVVLGSSHAAMWLAGLEGPAARGGTRIVPLVKYGCSPLILRTRVYGRAWPECATFRQWALRQIDALSPDQVVVGTHTYTNIDNGRGGQLKEGTPRYERLYARGMRSLVARLGRSTDDVVVLGDLARREKEVGPNLCLEANDRRLGPCVKRLDRRDLAMLRRDRAATLEAGGRFYDANRLLCVKRRCPVAAAGIYVNRDFSHVSRTWAVHVGGVLARRIGLVR